MYVYNPIKCMHIMYNNYIRLNLQLRLGERNKNYWVREKYDSTIEKR